MEDRVTRSLKKGANESSENNEPNGSNDIHENSELNDSNAMRFLIYPS